MSDINRENIQKNSREKRIAVRLAECALFVVLMVVSAYIQIPFPLVPLSFQTVVAVLAGLLLGAGWGSATVAVYVFMGLAGLPVFTSGGGFAYVLNLTFGYVLGFAAAAFAAGIIRGKGTASLRRLLLAAVVGFLVNYLFGIAYFSLIWKFYMHNTGLWNALVVYNFIYMPKDLVLCILAAFLARAVSAALRSRR